MIRSPVQQTKDDEPNLTETFNKHMNLDEFEHDYGATAETQPATNTVSREIVGGVKPKTAKGLSNSNQLLASLNRKKNEIAELLPNKEHNIEAICAKYNEYLVRLENLYKSFDGNYPSWFAKHEQSINEFQHKMNKIAFPRTRKPGLESLKSFKSASSTGSSTRIKLAEQKARNIARKTTLERNESLQRKKLELELEERRLKQEEEEIERTVLQEEIDKIDSINGSRASLDGSFSSVNSEKKVNETNHEGSSALAAILARQNEISLSLLQNQENIKLPNKDLQVFDGSDVTKFKNFMLKFERAIEFKCNSDEDRLIYLEQYTAGKAKKLVQACSHFDPSLAYLKAKQLLSEEYGNEHKIASHYIRVLQKWPQIKSDDAESLNEFSLFLIDCNNYLENMSFNCQLGSHSEIMNIVMKLPYKLRERWRRHSYNLQQRHSNITFSTLVSFVREEASIIRQPLFGDISEKKQSASANKVKIKSLATNSDEQNVTNKNSSTVIQCHFCKKSNHKIETCKLFESRGSQEKSEFIKKLGLCFGCLSRGHLSKDCTTKLVCSKCNKTHPTILHYQKSKVSVQNLVQNTKPSATKTSSNAVVNASTSASCQRVMYPVLPVRVRFPNLSDEIITNVVLDTCSSDCWINEKLLQNFDVDFPMNRVKLSTMEGINTDTVTKVVNNLIISDLDRNNEFTIPVAYTKPNSKWPFTSSDIPTTNDINGYTHLENVPFNFIEEPVGILLGMNIPAAIKPTEIVEGKPEEPFASLHAFGWALNGPVKVKKHGLCNRIKISRDTDLNNDIEALFAQDFFDDSSEVGPSQNDLKWYKIIEGSITLNEGHFEIDLPFKNEKISFPNNREQILKRFTGYMRKLRTNSTYYRDYQKFMDMMIERNFMEEVPAEEIQAKPGLVWYIPHHGVIHKQKGKLRVVFNCSQKFSGTSLNEQLLQGPNLVNNLVGVLIRFREMPCAFTGDIEKMYYQINVPAHQRDFLRLFWFDNYENIKEYRIRVHVFGAVSSPSVATYALQHVTSDSFNGNYSNEAKQTVLKNFYVDDLLKSTEDETSAIRLANEVKALVHEGGFNLTAFASNSKAVLMSVCGREQFSSDPHDINLVPEGGLPPNRALGLVWQPEADLLGFHIKVRPDLNEHMTKRSVLRYIASVYDPLGLSSPILISGKRVFQECCRQKLDWDELLPTDLSSDWLKWLADLPSLSLYTVPRCLTQQSTTQIDMHVFCDGSEAAYGAVLYTACYDSNGTTKTSLVMSKSRMTPLNKNSLTTTPRIELASAKLAVEIASKFKTESDLNIVTEFYWSDSVTVLRYVKSETGRFQRFVTNKVAYIRNFTSPQQWHYVPSSENPADIISRGASVNSLIRSSLWNEGPLFLKTRVFPSQSYEVNLPVPDPEVKSFKTETIELQKGAIDKLMNSTSDWFKLKCRIAWILKYKNWLRKSNNQTKLTVLDMKNAECEILKYVQCTNYSNLIQQLQRKAEPKKRNEISKLSPFLDDRGLMRVGGRLKNSSESYSTKHPIILPKTSTIVEALVRETHRAVGHLGRASVLAKLRKRFWIMGGNGLVRRLVRSCVACRKYQQPPINQIMGELPAERVTGDVPPFTHTGIDCFGPYEVIHGRKSEKRYGVIFICMSSKAIHLETIHSLSTDSFIQSLRRFVCRRGNVKSITSDNGTNFKGAEKELRLAVINWNNSNTETWLKQRNIDWKFNPPSASNFGGLWERHIKIIRKVLTHLMNEQPMKVNDEQLCTLMCEVEYILNSRPLTEVRSDCDDGLPLTPNDLLLLNSPVSFPPGLFTKDDTYGRRRWKQIQYLSNLFWTRWKREYLVLLNERQKWHTKQKQLHKGDIVLVMDQQTHRNQWPLAIVQEVIADRFGNVRVAKVKLAKRANIADSKCSQTVLQRPISKLILLVSSET